MHSTADTLKDQVLNFLSTNAKEQGIKTARGIAIQLDVTQGDIATLLGMSRADATRALNALKRDGTIVMEGSTIILRDEMLD